MNLENKAGQDFKGQRRHSSSIQQCTDLLKTVM